MIHAFSCYLVESMYRFSSIQQEKKSVYIYGMELLCSTGLSFMSILVISLFTGKLYCFFSFITVFYTVRVFSGGFHAATYRKCFLLTNLVYLSVLALGTIALYWHVSVVIPICVIVSSVFILIHAPVRNANHPLSDIAYGKNQLILRILVIVIASLLLLLLLIPNSTKYLYYPALSLAAVAVMIIPTIAGRRCD